MPMNLKVMTDAPGQQKLHKLFASTGGDLESYHTFLSRFDGIVAQAGGKPVPEKTDNAAPAGEK